MGHRKGRRKREKEVEKESVERALDVDHEKFCLLCGKRLEPLSVETLVALDTGICPCCGSHLKLSVDGVLFCSRRPLCDWCVYVSGLKGR